MRGENPGVGTSVQTSELEDNSVSTAKIQDNAVTLAKTTGLDPTPGTAYMDHTETDGEYSSFTTATAKSESSTTGSEATASYNSSTGGATQQMSSANFEFIGEKCVNTNCAWYNQKITKVKLWLKKNAGSPTGTATICVMDNLAAIQFTFGTIDVSTLTGSFAEYEFENLTGYTISTGEYIGIKYNGGDGSNAIGVEWANSDTYDSTDSIGSEESGGSWNDRTTQDLKFQFFKEATVTESAVDACDTDDATHYESDAGVNEWWRGDGGSIQNIGGIQFWNHANMTETEVLIQVSEDGSTWETMRTVTVSNMTVGEFTHWRFKVRRARYVRIYGNSGNSLKLAFNECEYLTFTDSEMAVMSGRKDLSSTSTTTGEDGT